MLKQRPLPHVSELPAVDEEADLLDDGFEHGFEHGSGQFADGLTSRWESAIDDGMGFRELLTRPEALAKRRRSTVTERDFDFAYRARPREVVRSRRLREAS